MGSLHEPQTSSEAKTPLRYAPLKKLRIALYTIFIVFVILSTTES
jgi:hypothetical protein